jgi:uncharacterized protein involved in exopolysaccharide biosynthesis
MMSEQTNQTQTMMQNFDEDEISLLDLLLVISENIKLLIIGPILAGLIALGYAFTITPTFTAKTTMLPPSGGSGGTAAAILDQLGPLAGAAGLGGGGGASSAIMAYLESDVLRDKVIAKFDLKKYYESEFQTQARASLKGATKITSDKKSNLIVIEVTDKSPKLAADIANFYVDAVREIMGTVAVQNARTQRELLERQIEEALKKPYQSPIIRDAVIQGLIRQAEMARLDESRRDGPLLTQVDVAQPPELKTGPKKAMIAVITSLAVGFALLLFVFIRSAMANANQDPESAQKLSRIKRAFRFW